MKAFDRASERKVLRSLGLSEYEARVYMSLVTEGASEGRKLSMRCGVPRTKVYTTLKKLKERGLVFELPEKPMRFAPASPAEAFKTYMQHLKDEASERMISLKESSKILFSLEEAYTKTQSTVKPRRDDLWIVQGRSNVLRKTKEMMARAKRSVNVITTGNGLVLYNKAVGKLIDKLVESGVNVRIGTQTNLHNEHLARELNHVCKVEHVDVVSPFLFLCVDGREFLLAELSPDDFNVDSGKGFGVISQNPEVCGLISLLLPRQKEKPILVGL